MNEFVRLTSRESGGELYVRRDMVAAVGSYRGVTHVTLVNEDIDYEVKESPKEVLRLITGEEHGTKTVSTRRQIRAPHLPTGRGTQSRPPADSVSV